MPHRLFVVPLSFEPQQNYQLYIRVASSSGLQSACSVVVVFSLY
ncbi:MAG: hypothetical protein IPG70_15455 [Moraxellaceae bacterium]|nr:hypothetical protein [Moraxellaceae bacterium]